MGIFKPRKSQKKSAKAHDPFDMFEQTDPFSAWSDVLPDLHSATSAVPRVQIRDTYREPSVAAGSESALPRRGVLRQMRKYLVNISMCGAVVTLGFVVAKTKPWTYLQEQKLVYAYFEVRAVDGSGRPVAGAIVKNGGKKVGVTDSFGEWRRYMRVPLGATVPVLLTKKSGAELLVASKNFAVPAEKMEKGDMELRGSVQLAPSSIQDKSTQLAQAADIEVKSEPVAMAQSKRDADILTKDTMQGAPANSLPSEPTSPTVNRADAHGQIPISSVKEQPKPAEIVIARPSFVSRFETIWIEGAGPSSSVLNAEVVPAVIQRATELGLKVDPKSEWKVRLTNLVDRPTIVDKDGGGLMSVSSTVPGSTESLSSFLRSYQTDAKVTARGILFILAHHVAKNVAVIRQGNRWAAVLPKGSSELWRLAGGMSLAGDGHVVLVSTEPFANEQMAGFYLQPSSMAPCAKDALSCELHTRSFAEVPPLPSWSKQHFKLLGVQKDPVKVFVSGYEARATSGNVFEYWGQDKNRANLTILQNGRVIHRSHMITNSHGLVTVAIGASTVSQR